LERYVTLRLVALRNGKPGNHPGLSGHPSIEGNESGFPRKTLQSGGAATIISAQGFNPGFCVFG